MSTYTLNKPLTNKEKDVLLKQVLGREYTKAGNSLPVLKTAIDIIGNVDDGLSLAELLPAVESVLSGSRILSFVAEGTSIFSIFLFPVSAMIDVINAYNVGHKMYAYRCVAYTVTSWAFDVSNPSGSMRILSNMRHNAPVVPASELKKYTQLWKKTASETIAKLTTVLITKNIKSEVMKIALRALAKNDPALLSEMIMRGFESKFDSITILAWKHNYSIRYPG